MHVTRITGGATLLLSAGLIATIAGPKLAIAGSTWATQFNCSSNRPCVLASNRGAGPGLHSSAHTTNGITAYSKSAVASGAYGQNDSSQGGTGVLGRTIGADNATGFQADGGAGGAIALYLTQHFNGFSYMFLGVNASNNPVIAAGNTGNLTIAGQLYTASVCYLGCSRTRRVLTYVGTSSRPTLHDNGEAQLHDGVASVPLDPAFRNAIDPHGYLVFVTPEGRTKGLYVAARSEDGFVVREIHGGHGSAGFAYRIVAHPFGVSAPRFPIIHDLRETERLAHVSH